MSEYTYTVVVDAENKEQADKVMRERLDYDEDIDADMFDGFLTYKIRYSCTDFSTHINGKLAKKSKRT